MCLGIFYKGSPRKAAVACYRSCFIIERGNAQRNFRSQTQARKWEGPMHDTSLVPWHSNADIVLKDPLKIQYRRRIFQSTLDGYHLKDGESVSKGN